MKKKISVAFVLAMALLLTFTAALAVSYWRDAARDVAGMEAEKGIYATWETEDKVRLITLLHDAEMLPEDDRIARILSEDTPETEKDKLADEVMMAFTDGGMDTITLDSILEQMNGPMSNWTPEDKVWYMDLLKESGLWTSEDVTYALPEGGELTQDQAIDLAKKTLMEVYGATADALDGYHVEATLSVLDWETAGYEYYKQGDRLWSVLLTTDPVPGEQRPTVYHADITSDGRLLGYIMRSSNEDGTSNDLPKSGIRLLVPQDGDIDEAEAVRIAKDTVQVEHGIAPDDLTETDAFLWLVDWAPEDGEAYELGDRVWTVTLTSGGSEEYRVEVKNDGSVMK